MSKVQDWESRTTRGNLISSIRNRMKTVSILLILIGIIIIASILSPAFLTLNNIMNISRQIAVTTIIAFAETLLIIAGMIDLSPGSVLALSGCVGVSLSMSTGSVWIGLFAAILIGTICGLIAGVTVTKFNCPPFIVTLAIMNITRGLALLYTGGQPIYNIGNFTVWGQGQLAFIPYSILITAFIALIAWFLLNQMKFGRHVYAIGGNQDAAKASGVNVDSVKIRIFLFAGMCSGLAGALLMSRVAGALPNAGVSYEFDGITAAIVGGTSMTGGIGTIFGTIIGAIIMGILNNILNLLAVPSYWQQVLKGIIIVVAVVLDIMTKGKQKSAKVLLKEDRDTAVKTAS